ncbi:MAG: helix-turn-helix transcriptional regulator [Atopobium sp.]|uniref:helix-turn-helix transcriptional regulator n=1 Tax=Atopobium sp. TaxID=1872650 RepID=UPI002A82086C|nr:helix-turn-helix transcriptional regulator [Atopobium sp.]MDY4522479.1 helix-turn-helix transcriptional regulator [Atopobium sp.]
MQTRLKEVRKDAGYNQQEASKLFGVSLGTYRNWEQGRVIMNGKQLIQAAEIFNSNIDYILMTDKEIKETTQQQEELDAIFQKLTKQSRAVLLDVAKSLELRESIN